MPLLPGQHQLVDGLRAADHKRVRIAKGYVARMFPGAESGALNFEDLVGPLEIGEAEEYWYHFGGRAKRRTITNIEVLDSLDTWLAMSLDPPTIPRPQKRENDAYRGFYAPSPSATLPYAQLVYVLSEGVTRNDQSSLGS